MLIIKNIFLNFINIFDNSCIAVSGKIVPDAVNTPTKHPLLLRYVLLILYA